LSSGLNLPFLKGLIEGSVDYGTNLLVEFEPDSIWYETSLTLAAQALKDGIRTDYHLFQHMPSELTEAFTRFGLDVKQLEEQDSLRILDSYTVQTGLGAPEASEKGRVSRLYSQSVKLTDWSITDMQRIKSGVPLEDKRRLHIDDNTGIMLQYNDEKAFIDTWRTRSRPHTKVQEIILFNSLMKGAASDAFTKQFELLSDVIIDIKTQEREERIEHVLRVRALRGRPYDSRWRRLRLLSNGEVALAD
jgi:KaiC/GvpD/RAD55 family RecA-like ATPase